MNVFELHRNVVADYEKYIRSFIRISDPKIAEVVDAELSRGKLWPEPLLQFNPAFESAGKVSDLAADGTVHGQVADIFKGYSLYQHQLAALVSAPTMAGKSGEAEKRDGAGGREFAKIDHRIGELDGGAGDSVVVSNGERPQADIVPPINDELTKQDGSCGVGSDADPSLQVRRVRIEPAKGAVVRKVRADCDRRGDPVLFVLAGDIDYGSG